MRIRSICTSIYCGVFLLVFFVPLYFFNFSGAVSSENRMLASFPALPKSIEETSHFTNDVEIWLNDRIGFRKELTSLYRRIQLSIFGVSPSKIVALGSDGTAFLLQAQHSTDKHSELFEAFGETPGGTSLYTQQIEALSRASVAFKASTKPVLMLAVPTSPLFRFKNLPKHVRMTVTPKTPKNHPVSRALVNFTANNKNDFLHFLHPFQESLDLAKNYTLYPQKNFHWSWSPFTVMVSEMIAEKFGHPITRRFAPEDFSPCAGRSDLAHLVGINAFINENDLCPSGYFYEGQKISSTSLKDAFPSPDAVHTTAGTLYKNMAVSSGKLLVIGDSFNFHLGLPLVRNFREVLVLDYYGTMRETQNNPTPVLRHLRAAYNPDQVVIVRHNLFQDIQGMPEISIFLQ